MMFRRAALVGAAAVLVGTGAVVAFAAGTASDPTAACSTPTPDGSGNYGSTCTFSIPQATVPGPTVTVPGPTTTVTETDTVPGPTTTVTVTTTPDPTTPPPTTPPPTTTPPPAPAFPDATDTGTPAGVTLHSCPTTITAAGTYDLCEFSGDLGIKASGVIITRSKVDGSVWGTNDDLLGVKISDTTVD